MIDFADNDKEKIQNAYKMLLLNLKDYVKQYELEDELEYAKIIYNMLHSGFFSVGKNMQIDFRYDYLALPSEISQGVQVMRGIACCRHVTEFLYDTLRVLNINPSIMYVWVDNATGLWYKVNPAREKANHQAILLSDKYIIDAANKFILKKDANGDLTLMDSTCVDTLKDYQDDNITTIDKILGKYYLNRELGVDIIYS